VPTSSTHTHVNMQAEALAYASRGFLVFPLWHVHWTARHARCSCYEGTRCGSPGKHPRTPRGLENWGASSDLHAVERWWSMWPDANIGMPAGANGLAVVDIDPGHGGTDTIAVLDAYCLERGIDPLATRLIRTGSGGQHRIYRQPPGGIISKSKAFGDDAPGVDTRGRGGYIVAPPSLHATGQRYEVIHNRCTIAPWPAPLTELLELAAGSRDTADETGLPPGTIACGPQPPTSGDRAIAWAFAGLLAETKRLEDLPHAEGNGKNWELYKAANKLGRRVGSGWLDEATVIKALLAASAGWPGHSDRERLATIRSGLRDGIADPHPGPTTRGGVR
jgi:hypothetical protein